MLNEWIGNTVAWLVAIMVMITFVVACMRYGFNIGSIAMQESIVYLHAIVFMLAIAYTYKHNEHVRVDIFYGNFSPKNKSWVDLLGTFFLLLPVCIYLVFISWEYAKNSWALFEGSPEAGGLPLVFILKTLVPLMPILLALQGIATICHSLTTIKTSK
jgi:TRAP-type mannitol/chloroaromatic compound transport system permease small subunit